MKQLLVLALALPAAFAAGWFLRPASFSSSGPDGGPGAVVVKNTVGQTKEIKKESPFPGPPPLEIKPLTSLAEILSIIGPDVNRLGPEEGISIMMELLPRLVVTPIPVIQTMLADLLDKERLDEDVRRGIAVGLLFRWMTVQPESAVGYSLAHPALLGDAEELNMMGLLYLAKTRPEAARSMAALMPKENRKDIDGFLTMLEATSNPGGVLQNPEKSTGLDNRQISRLAGRWALTDPAAAMAWRDSLPEGDQRNAVTAEIAASRMSSDPASAFGWISALPDGPEKEQSMNQMVGKTIRSAKDLDALESSLATLPPDWQDRARLQWIGRNGSASHTEKFQEILARNPTLAASDSGKDAATDIARSYGNNHKFSEGAQWAEALPDGNAKNGALTQITQQWTNESPEEASQWISGLPPGGARDAAATAMINQIQRDDPGSALVWAQSLSDPGARQEQSRGVFQAWFRKDPLEAISAIQNLPADQQQTIFRK